MEEGKITVKSPNLMSQPKAIHESSLGIQEEKSGLTISWASSVPFRPLLCLHGVLNYREHLVVVRSLDAVLTWYKQRKDVHRK